MKKTARTHFLRLANFAGTLVLAVVFVFTFARPAFAQSPQEIKGEVLKIENQQLSVETSDEQIQTFTIQENIKVSKNFMGAKAQDLKPGDSVTITQNNGSLVSVEAKSSNFWLKVIGAVVLLLTILLILSKFLKKKNEQHIKVTPITE